MISNQVQDITKTAIHVYNVPQTYMYLPLWTAEWRKDYFRKLIYLFMNLKKFNNIYSIIYLTLKNCSLKLSVED